MSGARAALETACAVRLFRGVATLATVLPTHYPSTLFTTLHFSNPCPLALGHTKPLHPLPPLPPASPRSLTGQIDNRLSLLTALVELDASGNRFTGPLGASIFYLPQLERLNLGGNGLSGTVPPSLG